jgi:hypothetical protein
VHTPVHTPNLARTGNVADEPPVRPRTSSSPRPRLFGAYDRARWPNTLRVMTHRSTTPKRRRPIASRRTSCSKRHGNKDAPGVSTLADGAELRRSHPKLRSNVVLGRLTLTLPVLGVATIWVAALATGASPRTTIVAGVTPFAADGHLRSGLRVVRETAGFCGPGSDVLTNDVYRCSSANLIFDPCWRDYRAVAPAVVCLGEPWGRTVTRLRLAVTPAPSPGHTNLKAEPWGITLGSNERCLAFQGAHDTVTGKEDGAVVDYYCSRTLALVRGIDRSHPTWTIRAAHITHQLARPYVLIGRVAIRTAWFGGNNPLSHHP